MEKPPGIYGRDRQWQVLERFMFPAQGGAPRDGAGDGKLRLGLVSGRRRMGKTQLLAALCDAVGGLYTVCVQDEGDRAARARFAGSVAQHAGLPASFDRPNDDPESWERLLRAALDTAARTAPAGMPALVVIDEFPYAMAQAPQLPSLLQNLYDDSQRHRGPGGRLILCGSALTVMHELLSGSKPLRGRATMDMRMSALDYRETAQLWGIDDPELALHLHAVVGGIPGYKALVTSAPATLPDFDPWVMDNLLSVDIGVFTHTEVDYLLREDPRITARALYNDVLSAVARGERTPTKIGAAIGKDSNAVRYPLNVLLSAGYISRTYDLLQTKKSTITLSDPIIRLDRLITAPRIGQLELGRVQQVWRTAAPTFRSQILGPHFEEIAREWVHRFAPDELNHPAGFGEIGYGTVHDHAGRAKHEIDVLGVDGQRITVMGEAKAHLGQRGLSDLERLDGIKHLLEQLGRDVSETVMVVFSSHGFTKDLAQTAQKRSDVELVDLPRLYGK